MADKRLYRVLTPDGQLSHDSFVLASEQPDVIQNGCVLVVNERDGTQLTIHRDRLFSIAKVGERKQACLRCGQCWESSRIRCNAPTTRAVRASCWSRRMAFPDAAVR